MVARFSELVIDCHDPRRLAEFWCEVLGYRILDVDDENGLVEIGIEPLDREALSAAPGTPTIVFAVVPESKTVKNRVHIDVNPVDNQQDEVDRILGLGARHVDVGQGEQSWVVLADPEGNEFCVLRSLAPSP
jgi:hypothetical protein